MITDQVPKEDVRYVESPASWNTRYITPAGYSCQITIRGENGKDLFEKAGLALAYLAEHQYLPDNSYHKNGNNESKLCPIHQCEMKKHEKDGKSWFSHKTDEGWCYGMPRKQNGGSHE